jgi:hypothetical protein
VFPACGCAYAEWLRCLVREVGPLRRRPVIYPMTEVRGLQLARNDNAAASGLMTEARQNRSPAAGAPSGAYANHVTLATRSASNAGMGRLARCGANRLLRPKTECLRPHVLYRTQEETALTPVRKGGASAPEKVTRQARGDRQPRLTAASNEPRPSPRYMVNPAGVLTTRPHKVVSSPHPPYIIGTFHN